VAGKNERSERPDRNEPAPGSAANAGSEAARRRGKLVAQGLFLVLAAAFVVISTYDVEKQAFGLPINSAQTGPNCSYLLGAFDEAITRGMARAAQEHTPGKAEGAFEDVVSPSLAAIEKHCTSPTDRDAFAAASRLRDAAQARVEADQLVLAPLRTAVQARRNP
jgi:hypothetical protein